MQDIVVIPSRGFALACDSCLDCFVLPQEGHRQAIEQRQVLDPGAVTLPHPVLIEGDIQHPMQPVLDPPVLPNGAGQPFHFSRQATEEYRTASLLLPVAWSTHRR